MGSCSLRPRLQRRNQRLRLPGKRHLRRLRADRLRPAGIRPARRRAGRRLPAAHRAQRPGRLPRAVRLRRERPIQASGRWRRSARDRRAMSPGRCWQRVCSGWRPERRLSGDGSRRCDRIRMRGRGRRTRNESREGNEGGAMRTKLLLMVLSAVLAAGGGLAGERCAIRTAFRPIARRQRQRLSAGGPSRRRRSTRWSASPTLRPATTCRSRARTAT